MTVDAPALHVVTTPSATDVNTLTLIYFKARAELINKSIRFSLFKPGFSQGNVCRRSWVFYAAVMLHTVDHSWSLSSCSEVLCWVEENVSHAYVPHIPNQSGLRDPCLNTMLLLSDLVH